MIKNIIIGALLCTSVNSYAQMGSWSGSSYQWLYRFDSAAKTFGRSNTNGSITSICTISQLRQSATALKTVTIDGNALVPAFMPTPPSGQVRLLIQTAGSGATERNGGFDLDFMANTLRMSSSGVSNVNKIGVYNIPEATPVAAFSFNISFNTSASNGTWYLGLGKNSATAANARLYDGDNKIHPTSLNPDIFTALRWQNTDTAIHFFYRTSSGSSAEEKNNLDSNPFEKGETYHVELYCNNSSDSQSYTISSNTYLLPSRTYHLWVDGTQLSYASGNKNFPGSIGELARDTVLSGLAFMGFASTMPQLNAAEITLSELSIEYKSDELSALMGESNTFSRDDIQKVGSSTALSGMNIQLTAIRNNQVHVTIHSEKSVSGYLILSDIMGRRIAGKKLSLHKGTQSCSLLGTQPFKGIYVLSLMAGEENKYLKFVK